MCGLCGVLSPLITANQEAVFQDLMVLSTLRGPWGSGFVAVPKRHERPIEILRNPSLTAAELAYSNDYYNIMSGKNKKFVCLMGHARYPTTGGQTLEDCHPHESGHIIGMHNGTMDTVDGKVVGKKDSDSSMLMAAIATNGLKPVLENSQGAYALTLINKNAGTLTFVRNSDRPLYFAKAADVDDGLYWASEVDMLRMALERRDRFRKSKSLKYLRANPLTAMSFRLYNMGLPEILETKEISPTLPSKEKAGDEIHHITLRPFSLKRGELVMALAGGCAYCGDPSSYDDYCKGTVHFFTKNEFMCEQCLKMDPTAQEIFVSNNVDLPKSLQRLVKH